MTPVVFALSVLSWSALALLVWKGRHAERIAALAFFIVMVGSPFVEQWTWGGIRIGVATLSFGLACTLTVLSLFVSRWWLMVAAGVQIVALATYGAALINPDLQVWSLVSIRMVVWVELMLIALFGVIEARTAPYALPSHTKAAS